ncbi:MAG: P-loop NTPase [Sandaracinaceae bacterium]
MTGPLFLSVGGGKGGVGKSVVAANLAIACAELGFRTVLVDADLGAANQHSLFGIDRPGLSLQSLLDRDVASLEEVTVPTGVSRLFFIPGIGAIPGAANLRHARKLKVLRHLAGLDAEVVVIDVGAGVSFNVLDFFERGDVRLVVTTPQLPAMQNAYCFLKAAVYRFLEKTIADQAERDALRALIRRSETDRFRELRGRAQAAGACLDLYFERVTAGFEARIVGNMRERPIQRRVFDALSRMAEDFLDIRVPVAATLGLDRAVHESVSRRRPFLLSHPRHPDARAMRALAESLLTVDVDAIRRRRITERPPPLPPPVPLAAPDEESRFGVPLVPYLRSGERVAVDHPVLVRWGGRELRARVADLSPNGALLVGHLPTPAGEPVAFTLTGFRERPQLEGVVRHISIGGDHIGVELSSASEPVARWLLGGDVPRRTDEAPGPVLKAAGL